MRSSQTCRSSEGGFTILETLVAMTVALIGLAGLVAMYSSTIAGNRSADRASHATAIGAATVEELRGMSIDEILTNIGTGTFPVDEDLSDVSEGPMDYRRHLLVEEIAADDDLVLIHIDVEWTDNGAAPGDPRYDHVIALEVVRTKLDLL